MNSLNYCRQNARELMLEGHVRKLEVYIDDADAYERRDTIIITGLNLLVSLQGPKRSFTL